MENTKTLRELIAALEAVDVELDPIARARACPALARAATSVLGAERQAAIREAAASGMNQTAIAKALGVGRGAVSNIVRRTER